MDSLRVTRCTCLLSGRVTATSFWLMAHTDQGCTLNCMASSFRLSFVPKRLRHLLLLSAIRRVPSFNMHDPVTSQLNTSKLSDTLMTFISITAYGISRSCTTENSLKDVLLRVVWNNSSQVSWGLKTTSLIWFFDGVFTLQNWFCSLNRINDFFWFIVVKVCLS